LPIKELQQRLTQVGVIRLGEQRISKNNKPYPAKLDTFRVTSPSKDLVDAVAALYGGQVTAWPEGPGGGQWQVVTKTTEIPVHVLPQKIDPNYELWGNGFRSRLCDGETERVRNCPCFCAADRAETEANGGTWVRDPRRHCKPTKAEFEGGAGQPAGRQPAPQVEAEAVDAEVEPDMDATWGKILKAGAQRGWNLPAIEERYRSHMGHDPADEDVANGFKYAAFLAAVEDGLVQ
jgi:hypothetical protein